MIRRDFLSSILGGIGLGWLAPKVKAVPKFSEPTFIGRHYDILSGITFSSSRILPRTLQMDKGVMHIEIDGRTVCSLLFSKAQAVTTFWQEEYKSGTGQIVYQSDLRARETTVQLQDAMLPSALMQVLVEYMGDVAHRGKVNLVLCSIDGKPKEPGQCWKVTHALLSVLSYSTSAENLCVTKDLQFVALKVERDDSGWHEALLRTMPDPGYSESCFNAAMASETVIPFRVIR